MQQANQGAGNSGLVQVASCGPFIPKMVREVLDKAQGSKNDFTTN